jgi:hypothetical protein
MHEPSDHRSRRLSRVEISVPGLTPAIDDAKVAATPTYTDDSNADAVAAALMQHKERQSEHENRKADRERRIEDSVAAAARAELEQREALRQDKEREVRNELVTSKIRLQLIKISHSKCCILTKYLTEKNV